MELGAGHGAVPLLQLLLEGRDDRAVKAVPQAGAVGPSLERFDGCRTSKSICDAFEEHFGDPLADSDLDDFLGPVSAKGMLRKDDDDNFDPAARPKPHQGLLSYRRNLFDPDRFFSWLEPKIRLFRTPGFAASSAACILLAAWTVWMNREELARPPAEGMGWKLLALCGLTLLAFTILHEFAHGLTCKHHGGEVHEVGFLMLFFMPGMLRNVWDPWLIPEKSKRLWVTLAGGYFELCLWSLAVLVWRLAVPGSLPNTLAWTVVSVSGARALFNFNPLMKFDGYYFPSDLVEVPNLRQRAFDAWLGRLRWLFWGGPKPEPQPRGLFLLLLGMVSWCFSVAMVAFMALGLSRLVAPRAGWLSILWRVCPETRRLGHDLELRFWDG